MTALSDWGSGFLDHIERHGEGQGITLAALCVANVARHSLAWGCLTARVRRRGECALAQIMHLPTRTWGAKVLKEAEPTSPQWPKPLAATMLAFGRMLREAGKHRPAIDVFSTVADSPLLRHGFTLEAMQERAYAARSANRLDFATMAYGELGYHARHMGATHYMLASRKGFACIAAQRGEFHDADRMFTDLAESAHLCRDTDIECDANNGIAWTAGALGQYRRALFHALSAVRLSPPLEDGRPVPKKLRRSLLNVAAAYERLGDPEQAAYLARLLASSTDREERWAAEHTIERAEASLERATPAEVRQLLPIVSVVARAIDEGVISVAGIGATPAVGQDEARAL